MIKLLYKGELIRENGIIKKASSSVTLIQTENHNIIVDTSTKDKRELIIEELKKQIKFDVENLKRHWRDNVGRAAEV